MSSLSGNRRYNVLLILFLIISASIATVGSFLSASQAGGGTINITLILIPFLLFIPFIFRHDPLKLYSVTQEQFRHIFPWQWIILGVLLQLITLPFIFLIPGLLTFQSVGSVFQTLTKLPMPVAICIAFFDTAAGTFTEEAIFRGLIQKSILRLSFLNRLNPWFAITVQAVLFGLAHGLPASTSPLASPAIVGFFFAYPALMGGLMGYISYRYRSLFPVWYMHWFGNFVAAIITIIGIM